MEAGSLAETLIAVRALASSDLESVLQRQVVLGGSLDTNLLESELLSEPAVLEALGRAHSLPIAGKAEIDAVGPHIPSLFPLVFAETYHLVPALLDQQTLHVLSNGPPDPSLCERIGERLHLRVAPIVTTEVRLHYAMHRLYGSALLPRYQSLIGKLDGSMGKPQTPPDTAAKPLSWGVSPARVDVPAARSHKLRGQDIRTLVGRLDAAANRDAIVDILLGFSLAVFEFTGLFVVQGSQIQGWRGTDAEATRSISQVSLPLSLPSVFQTVFATQSHYLGPLPRNSANSHLLDLLGRSAPRAAFLAPLTVGGKMAAILYADNGQQTVLPKRVAALLVLVQRAALGFDALIRRKKGAGVAKTAPAVAENDFSAVVDAPQRLPHASTPAGGIGVALGDQTPSPPAEAKESHLGLEIGQQMSAAFKPAVQSALQAAGAEPANASYVAFADVDEGPQGSLGEWEDVMVEAVNETSRAEAAPKKAPASVTWQQVVDSAVSASALVPQVARTVAVAGTVIDEQDLWFDGLEADSFETRQTAVSHLLPLGSGIDAELDIRFPGRLAFDPLQPRSELPALELCSGVTQLLVARGLEAAPWVLKQLERDDPVRRFFAIYFFFTIPYPQAVEALARRLYDTEARNRHLAVEALRQYNQQPAYQTIVQNLRQQLQHGVAEAQAAAIQILAQLREPSVVPELIPLVGAGPEEIVRTAASALALLCAQAFGRDLQGWHLWWQGNYNKPRVAWLIGGLQHNSAMIRRVANNELQQLTGQSVPFDPEGPENTRQAAVNVWLGWLQGASPPSLQASEQ